MQSTGIPTGRQRNGVATFWGRGWNGWEVASEIVEFPFRFPQAERQRVSLKWTQLLVNDSPDYCFSVGETSSSSFLNSIMRSRIIAAFSNSRFLAAAFIWDSSCLMSRAISSLEMGVTA